MVCPSCKNEIADGSIICPVCNTQFAFTVPGQAQTYNPNLYEVIPVTNSVQKKEETVYSPNANVLPTEISHYKEEEVNTAGNVANVTTGIEQQHEESYNPNEYHTSPLRPEAPKAIVNPVPVQPQVIKTQVINTAQTQQPIESPPNTNVGINNANNTQVVQVNNGIATAMQTPVQTNVTSTQIATEATDKKQKIKKTDMFFGGVVVIGLIIIVVIIISLIGKSKNKNPGTNTTHKPTIKTTESIISENVGVRSMYNYPMKVGDTTLASIFDPSSEKYYDVDVKGIRFIEGQEAIELAKNNVTDPLIEGFSWYAFEYQVKFNDLKNLTGTGISPVLDSKFYQWIGATFVTYNENNYIIKTYNVYNGGPILNKGSATVKVVYQLPATQREYSICFGDIKKTMGCFSKW